MAMLISWYMLGILMVSYNIKSLPQKVHSKKLCVCLEKLQLCVTDKAEETPEDLWNVTGAAANPNGFLVVFRERPHSHLANQHLYSNI